MEWITTVLTHNEIVLCERYTWSGVVYSSTLDPTLDLQGLMSVEEGIIAPDLVVYIDTPPSRVVGKHAITTTIWLVFPTKYLDWGSSFEARDTRKQMEFLQSSDCGIGTESMCYFYFPEMEISMGWYRKLCCMFGPIWAQRRSSRVLWLLCNRSSSLSNGRLARRTVFSICCACGEVAPETLPPLPPPEEEPSSEDDKQDIIPLGPEVREPEMSEGFLEQLQESGSTPCETHGMDHLSYDPTCEHCKRALGPMYRHLKTKYGPQIADHTPTLSFDFSGPLPAAVTGACYLMVFVWRLQEVRLIWAFALDRRTKENGLSCLQSVVADLNTLTGGSKPPVARAHSDQAKEFLSHMVMEWLKEHGIRQTFTSTYDSQANGVEERWINLIKTKATVLLASKYMHTSFWCYAVAWVAKCYNQKVLGQKPRKNLLEFGQLLLVRTKRNHKLEERGRLGIMAGTYPVIPNGVIVLSVQNHSIQEIYTAHVAPATFSDKDRWFITRDRFDPNKIVYVMFLFLEGAIQTLAQVRSGPVQVPSRGSEEVPWLPSRFAMCFVLQRFGPIQVPRWGPSRPVLVPSCSRAFLPGSGLAGPKQTSWPLPRA